MCKNFGRAEQGRMRKDFVFKWKGWGERRDLNPRPSVPQTDALPAELRSPPSDYKDFIPAFAKPAINNGRIAIAN